MSLKIQLADEYSHKALAEPATLAPEDTVSQDVLKQRDRALLALSVMAEAVSTQLSVDAVLQQALDQALETLDVEAGAITLVTDVEQAVPITTSTNSNGFKWSNLVFRAQKGWKIHDFAGQRFQIRTDQGLAGIVMHTGRPAVTADVDMDPRIVIDMFRDEPVKAMILAPMRARGRVLGLLSVMSYKPRRFMSEEVALLAALADQVGVAVDNAHLYEKEQARRQQAEKLLISERRRAEEMTLLRETLVRMAGINELPNVLEHLTQTAQQISQANIVEADLYNAAHDHLTLGMAWHADGTRHPLCCAPLRNRVAWEAIHRRETVQREVTAEDGYLPFINYVIALPIIQQTPTSAPVGVILMGDSSAPGLDAQAQSSLALLADQAALALDRLRLYNQERRKAADLILVNQIGRAAMAHMREDDLVSQIVQKIQREFELYNVSLYMGHPLILQASSGGQSVFPGLQLEAGLPLQAFKQRKPLLANRIKDNDDCAPPPWVADNASAEIALPLLNGDQVIGVLDIFSIDLDAFDTMDLDIMNILANQLAAILENQQLYTQMERRVAELAAVHGVTLQVLGALNISTLTHIIAQPFLELLSTNTVVVYPVRSGRLGPAITQVLQTGPLPEDTFMQSLAREALALQEPLQTGTITGLPWKHANQSWEESHKIGPSPGALLAIPLRGRGTLQGILLLCYQTPHIFSEDEYRTLELLINLTAVALSKALLYEESRQRVQELTLLYEIALKTRTLNTPQDITRMVAEALQQTMTWQNVAMYRWNEATKTLDFIYATDSPTPKPTRKGLGEKTNLLNWVVAHRRPMRLANNSLIQGRATDTLKAELAVPMMVADRLVGVLYVQNHQNSAFNSRDEGFLITVAHLLAVSLENVSLHQQTKQQLQETTTLYSVTQAITRSLFLEHVLQEIVTAVHKALNARGCCVAMLDTQSQELVIRAAAGITVHWQKHARLKLGQGIAGHVAQEGQACYVPDTQEESDFIYFDQTVRSLIVVPLISSQGETMGTLSVDSNHPHAFSKKDERLLKAVASQVAIAIENARLYEDLAQRNKTLNRAYQELQKLTEMKDQLVQNISHELRTPMTYIRGYIELLAEGNLGSLQPEQKQTLDLLIQKIDEVTRVIEEAVSSKRFTQEKLNRLPVQVDNLLKQTLVALREDAQHRGVNLHLSSIDPQMQIYGDPERLNQLCNHILENAVKFSPYGSEVKVTAQTEDGLVHLTFTDQGIGIPQDQLENIFDTFYQIKHTKTHNSKGLGIGLSVVRRIAEAHEGIVWAESEIGKGSTFHVLLPRYTPYDKGSDTDEQSIP